MPKYEPKFSRSQDASRTPRRRVTVPEPERAAARPRPHGSAADARSTPQRPKQSRQTREASGIQIPSMAAVATERKNLRYRSDFLRMLRSTIGILVVVAAAAALVAMLCLPVMQVSGNSMEPTLQDKDIIVLFKQDHFQTGDLVGLYYNGKIMLKRIIGQAGDYINIDADGNVYVNGTYLDEPYITGKSLGDCDLRFPYQVPDSSCFVLGDHRSVSTDSRNSVIGCIRTEQIIGKIIFRIWPLNQISLIH